MKKEFNYLKNDEKKEMLLLEGLTLDLPYAIFIVPFLVIALISSNSFISGAALIISIIFMLSYVIDRKVLRRVYGL